MRLFYIHNATAVPASLVPTTQNILRMVPLGAPDTPLALKHVLLRYHRLLTDFYLIKEDGFTALLQEKWVKDSRLIVYEDDPKVFKWSKPLIEADLNPLTPVPLQEHSVQVLLLRGIRSVSKRVFLDPSTIGGA